MTPLPDRANAAAGANESWSGIRFQEELRRMAQAHPVLPVENPLPATLSIIEQNPAFLQSRLLTRLLTTLTYERGEFRRAELSALDSKTLAVVISLMDGFAAGLPVRDEWIRAVDKANAAQLAAG